MLKLTLSTIRGNKARFLLTSVAVVLGVAFMAGTLVLTDTIKQSYNDIAGNVYKSTDAVVQSASSVTDENKKETRGTIDAKVLDQVRTAPGVAVAEPQVVGVALVVGRDGDLLDSSRNRAIPIAMGWQSDKRLNPMQLVRGHAPSANEVVIDIASADKGKFAVGDAIRVVGKTGSVEYHLAGVATYAGKKDAAGAQVVAFAPDTAAEVLGQPGRYNAVTVVAKPGVSQATVANNITAVLHNDKLDVMTGAEATADARAAAGAQLSFLNTFLLTFALVALLVGSFVIYNTFSITVAQRTRENALLRAIGAKRKQVMRSLVLESVLTGLFASAIGVAAGIGTAKGIAKAFTAFGFKLPAAGTVVKPSTIVVSMVVGTIVTVLAAYLPARKAGKVAPIAALRDVAVDRTGASVRRAVIGTVVMLLGAAFLAMGLSGGGVGPVALGALAVFVGVAVLGPVIARPFARLIGSPLPRLRGMAGTIARENATRNPRRTSATASALMIGIGLVAFITVFAASTKSSIASSIDNSVRTDWIVETAWGMGGLSPDAAVKVAALPETGSVTSLRYAPATVNGSAQSLAAFDPKVIGGAVDLHAVHGNLHELGTNDLAVWKSTADDNKLVIGDKVPVVFPESGKHVFTVKAIYAEEGPTGGYAISLAAFNANVPDKVDSFLLVDTAKGYSSSDARTAIEKVLHNYPNASVRTQDEFKGTIASQIDQMLNLVYVLLFMALAIALFGIANTLALSVFERTREIGLLRAVGMSRKQVRQSVRWESVLIALLGTTLGTAIGLGFGWALVHSLADKGITDFTVPAQELGVVIAVAAASSVIAAALPARRASRLDVLTAISE
jgi:putative ABC transport system permease protein